MMDKVLRFMRIGGYLVMSPPKSSHQERNWPKSGQFLNRLTRMLKGGTAM